MERRVEFHCEGQKIAGNLHVPGDGEGPFPGVVVAHGYMANSSSEKYLQIGYRFPPAGIAVLRFDHRGALGGESEGKFEDTTLTGRVKDLQAALEYLKGVAEVDSSRLGLLGSSLGGRAVLALPKDENIRAVVTLAAPYSFPRQREEMRASLSEKGYFEFPDGSRIKRDFYDDLRKYDIGAEVAKTTCPLLIIHGDLDDQVPRHNAFNLYRRANEPKKLVLIAGGGHGLTDLDKLNQALELSLDWFRQHLLPAL